MGYYKRTPPLNPGFVLGVDPNDAAIKLAQINLSHINNIEFQVKDVYSLPPIKNFDIAIIRGVLHHLDHVQKAIKIICNIAHEIVVAEPNGYNPVLKILEKISPYHILHEEKSYSPRKLDKWFEKNGGIIIKSMYVGFVPLFCLDFLAKILNFLNRIWRKHPYCEHFPVASIYKRFRLKINPFLKILKFVDKLE